MKAPLRYRQLEIWWVDLEPTRGAETRKKRPCVVIQSDIMNHSSRTVIMAPLLPGHKAWPFAVNVSPTKGNGLDKDRHINFKQLRGLDISRVGRQQGILETRYFPAIEKALKIIFGLEAG